MATQTIKTLSVRNIFADYGRNVRMSSKYRVEPKENFNPEKDTPGFYEDILQRGVQVKIEVAELTPDQTARVLSKMDEETRSRYANVDGDKEKLYRVIRGHRRFKAVELINANHGSLIKDLSCVVYRGLTEAEEIQLMVDHTGVEPLNDFEMYLAVKRLFGTNLSQEAIGTQLGMSRGPVQKRIWIMEMPAFVEDNYRKRFEPNAVKGRDYVPFTDKDVEKLHKAWGEDNDAQISHDSDASAFLKVWNDLANKTNGDPIKPKKALSLNDMEKRSGLVKGREALEVAHKFYANDGGNIVEAVEIYDALTAKAASAETLKIEVASLKNRVAELEQEVSRLNSEVAERDARLSALTVDTPAVENNA